MNDSADHPLGDAQLTRRRVALGAAWSVPAVVATNVLPAYAASQPFINRTFRIVREGCGSGGESSRIVVTTDNATYSYRIMQASGSTVTSVTASVLIEKSLVDAAQAAGTPLTWTSTTASWSNPVVDTSQTYVVGGRQYVRYVSNLLTPVPAPDATGVITFPVISWQSSCSAAAAGTSFWVDGRGGATINGSARVDVGQPRLIDADAASATIERSFSASKRQSGCSAGTRILATFDNSSSSFYRITNVLAGATVTDIFASVLVQKTVVDSIAQAVSFTSSNPAWVYQGRDTQLFYDTAGRAYYRYYFRLNDSAIPAPVNGTITLPTTTFASTCHAGFTNNTVGVEGRGVVTVNGTQLRASIGVFRYL